MNNKQIKKDLLDSFIEPDLEKQYKGILLAIHRLDLKSQEEGVNSVFLIGLRDYLLDYELNKNKNTTKNQKLKIHFSEEDLQELQNGETFDWTFRTDKGEDIDIHLYQGEDEE